MADPVKISQDYEWGSPSLDPIIHVVEMLLPLSGVNPRPPTGSVAWMGPPRREKRWEGVAALRSALDEKPESINAGDAERSWWLDLDLSDGLLSLRIEVPEVEEALAREFLAKIENDLGLEVWERRARESEKEVAFCMPTRDPSWIANAVTAIVGTIPRALRFYGSYEVGPEGQERIACDSLESWQGDVVSRWDEILRFDAEFRRRRGSREISLNGNRRDQTISLRVMARSSVEAEGIIANLKDKLNLQHAVSRAELRGEKRVYLVDGDFDDNWLNATVALLEELNRGGNSFNGRYTIQQMGDQDVRHEHEYVMNATSSWRERILEDWDRLVSFSAAVWLSFLELHLSCEYRRELVEIEVKARSDAESERILNRFEQELSLRRAPDVPWNFRTRGEYRIRGWTAERFISALNDAVDSYVGAKYQVFEAFVIQGKDSRTRRDFLTLENLVGHLRGKEDYCGVSVAIEGPGGNGIGIHVRDDLERLELRSTLAQRDFRKLKKKFAKLEIGKLEKASDEEDKPRWVKTLTGRGVIAIGALLLALVSWEGIRIVQPRYILVITQPASFGDELERLPEGTAVRVEWLIQREQFTNRVRVDPGTGTVTVYKAGGEVERELKGVSPGVDLPDLASGRYTIQVDVPRVNQPEEVQIEIFPQEAGNRTDAP